MKELQIYTIYKERALLCSTREITREITRQVQQHAIYFSNELFASLLMFLDQNIY